MNKSLKDIFDLRWPQVVWTAGSTQGGSSGAALVDLATRRIIGVLTGGFATCLQPRAADYFGRLSVVTYLTQIALYRAFSVRVRPYGHTQLSRGCVLAGMEFFVLCFSFLSQGSGFTFRI